MAVRTSEGNVYITKLEAARRQLATAVRLFIHGEDELAVHTVASAAAGIISDLGSMRGRDEAAEYTLAVLFGCLLAYRSEEIPRWIAGNPETLAYVSEVASYFPTITSASTWEEFRGLIGEVSMRPESVRDFWKDRNRVANFLKHADRDSSAHINEGEFDNLNLLMLTVTSYHDLVPFGLRAEGYVLWFYSALDGRGTRAGFGDDELKLLAALERTSDTERVKFFDELLAAMKEHYGEV